MKEVTTEQFNNGVAETARQKMYEEILDLQSQTLFELNSLNKQRYYIRMFLTIVAASLAARVVYFWIFQ